MGQQTSFFNTIGLTGQALKKANDKALTQEQIVLRFFEANPGRKFAPHHVQNALLMGGTPESSFRRAFTNLKDRGHIVKTDEMAPGNYGKPVHLWELAA